MKDPALRRCSRAARGMWADMICLMFECADRGVLATGGEPWSDEDICAATGGDLSEGLACIAELLRKGAAFRNQSGAIFSKRVVRDEQTRRADRERQRESRKKKSTGSRGKRVTPLSHDSSSSSSSSSSSPPGNNGSNRNVDHTHYRGQNGVCVSKSNFSLTQIREYAWASWHLDQRLIGSGKKQIDGIRNPDGWAVSAHRSGEFDQMIQEWVNDPKKFEIAS